MDVHDHRVGAGGDRGAGERDDQVALAAAVAGVHDDRQVRQAVDHRHGGDVEGVAGGLLERPDAALAQDDVEVAALRDVLRGHEPLLVGRGHAALEHDRLAGAADGLEEREVLHVAGADLEHVGPLSDQRDVSGVDHLGHHGQARLGAYVGEDPQALLAQSLEGVRRGARLVGASSEQRRAGGLGHLRGLQRLLGRLDGARAGDEGERARPDRDVPDADRRRLGVVLPADELVGLGDPDDLLHARHHAQVEALERDDVADQSDDRALHAAADEGAATRAFDARDDGVDVLGGGAGAHHDDHGVFLQQKEPQARGPGLVRSGASAGTRPGVPVRKAIPVGAHVDDGTPPSRVVSSRGRMAS